MASSDSGYSSSDSESSSNVPFCFNPEQIERLEQVFMENMYPSKIMREELSAELGATPAQIKLWFKNKILSTRAENHRLRMENARIGVENLQMHTHLMCSRKCLACEAQRLDQLSQENAILREQSQRVTDITQQILENSYRLAQLGGGGFADANNHPEVDLELRLAPPPPPSSEEESDDEGTNF